MLTAFWFIVILALVVAGVFFFMNAASDPEDKSQTREGKETGYKGPQPNQNSHF